MGKEFFHALFDLAADSMLILDLDGCIKDINPIAYGRLGYTKADMVGKQIGSFILPEFVAKLDNRFAKVQQNGYLVYESAQVRKDGSVLPVEISSRADRAGWGSGGFQRSPRHHRAQADRNAFAGKRRKMAPVVREHDHRLCLARGDCDEQGRVVDYRFLEINPAYERLTGLKAGDMIGHTVLDRLPGTEPYWIEVFGNVALSGEPTTYENFSSELERWYQARVFSPKIRQFAVIISDITECKNFEEKLRLSSLVLENSSEGMVVTDADNLIVAVNPAFSTITGYSFEEVKGKNPSMLKFRPP